MTEVGDCYNSSLYTFFDFSLLGKEDFEEDLQIFNFRVLKIICALVISRTFFANQGYQGEQG